LANDKAANNQEVDLDDIEVVILIIAKSPAKIGQAANFLSRRGWPATAMNNLSQAIEFATDRKPDFVLISVNHPNPAINKFCELLTSTFGTTCVAFAENNDTASSARLMKSALPMKIQGQASGPNLHRSLRKFLADKFNIDLDDKNSTPERSSGGDKNFTVKGGANDGQTIVQKNDAGATQGKGPTTIKGEGAGTADSGYESESVSTGKYTMTKKARRTLKELSQNPLDKPGDVVMGEEQANLAKKLKESLFGAQPESEFVPNENDEVDSALSKDGREFGEDVLTEDKNTDAEEDDGPITSRQHNGGQKPSQMSAQIPRPSSSHNQAGNEGPGGRANSQTPGHAGAIGHPGYEHGPQGTQAQGITPMPLKPLSSVGPHSLIERAVHEALAQICRPSTGAHEPIALIEQVGVFPIDSASLPGYLVLAWPHEEMRAIEPFFKQAQQIIAATFQQMSVQARIEPGFFVTLPQVNFGPWAQETAAFSFSTSHGNEEIGVAFFPTHKPIPKPKQIEDKTMYAVELENISTETPVNFKVYLHMKKNKKYFLYLRNGRQLQPEQKERLAGNQVKDLYMKTIDIENLRMFLATCHLTRNIKRAG